MRQLEPTTPTSNPTSYQFMCFRFHASSAATSHALAVLRDMHPTVISVPSVVNTTTALLCDITDRQPYDRDSIPRQDRQPPTVPIYCSSPPLPSPPQNPQAPFIVISVPAIRTVQYRTVEVRTVERRSSTSSPATTVMMRALLGPLS